MEPRTRISRGFAFVTMDTLEEADRAVRHLNHSVLEGRYITVEKVKFYFYVISFYPETHLFANTFF